MSDKLKMVAFVHRDNYDKLRRIARRRHPNQFIGGALREAVEDYVEKHSPPLDQLEEAVRRVERSQFISPDTATAIRDGVEELRCLRDAYVD